MLLLLFLSSIIRNVISSPSDSKIFFVDVQKNSNGYEHAKIELNTNMEENIVHLMYTKASNNYELESSTKWKIKKTYSTNGKNVLYINLCDLPLNYNYCFCVEINGEKHYSAAFYKDRNGNWKKSSDAVMSKKKKTKKEKEKEKEKEKTTNNVLKNYVNFNIMPFIIALLSFFIFQ